MLHCEISVPGMAMPVHCINVHLGLTEGGRKRQLAMTAARVRAMVPDGAPLILAGDFNSTPGSPVMELLEGEWTIVPKTGSSFTFPADGPEREIDFVLIRPKGAFRILEHRVLGEEVASDHRPIFLVLEF